MGKINSADIHKSENASIAYGSCSLFIIREIRKDINVLKESKKADEWVLGLLHALRKIIENELTDSSVNKIEVEEWKILFFKWFEKIKKNIPEDLRQPFKDNLEGDFNVILSNSNDLPEFYWRKQTFERQLVITVENENRLNLYQSEAEKKHPVKLGNALHVYVETCLERLINDGHEHEKNEILETETLVTTHFMPTFSVINDKNVHYTLTNFHFFDTKTNIEQDILINAYDLEDAIKKYLNDTKNDILSDLQFDCESSMFSVHAVNMTTLFEFNTALFTMGSHSDLKEKYLSKKS
jgi:hypothetical protein